MMVVYGLGLNVMVTPEVRGKRVTCLKEWEEGVQLKRVSEEIEDRIIDVFKEFKYG